MRGFIVWIVSLFRCCDEDKRSDRDKWPVVVLRLDKAAWFVRIKANAFQNNANNLSDMKNTKARARSPLTELTQFVHIVNAATKKKIKTKFNGWNNLHVDADKLKLRWKRRQNMHIAIFIMHEMASGMMWEWKNTEFGWWNHLVNRVTTIYLFFVPSLWNCTAYTVLCGIVEDLSTLEICNKIMDVTTWINDCKSK